MPSHVKILKEPKEVSALLETKVGPVESFRLCLIQSAV